jgi:hypothetical protein
VDVHDVKDLVHPLLRHLPLQLQPKGSKVARPIPRADHVLLEVLLQDGVVSNASQGQRNEGALLSNDSSGLV